MGAHLLRNESDDQNLRGFLEAHWAMLLAGEQLVAAVGEVEDPAERFEWFAECGDRAFGSVRRYAMPLRDGSRICADVEHRRGQIRFFRDRHDPGASVGSLLRYAVRESAVARAAAGCVAVFRRQA